MQKLNEMIEAVVTSLIGVLVTMSILMGSLWLFIWTGTKLLHILGWL